MTIKPSSAKGHFLYDLNVIVQSLKFLGGDGSSAESHQKERDVAHAVIGLTGTPLVPKGWNRDSRIQQMREQLLNRSIQRFEANCPPAILELFQSHGFPISSLPYLHIPKNLPHHASTHIDSDRSIPNYPESLTAEHLPEPLMRFEDPTGRCGIALKVYDQHDQNKQKCAVVFQQSPASKDSWIGSSEKDSYLFPHRHLNLEYRGQPTHQSCVNFQALQQMLEGTHPRCKIAFPSQAMTVSSKMSPTTKSLIIGAIAAVVLAVLAGYLFRADQN